MKRKYFILLIPFFISSCMSYFTIAQDDIDLATTNYDNNETTAKDLRKIKRFYRSLIFGGSVLYPEASKILKHYLFGDGSDLYIRSRYFFKSDIISSNLENMNSDESNRISLRISDDPRIAYAVNGFTIKKIDSTFYVTQYIEFDISEGTGVHTSFPRGYDTLYVPDRLIRIFEPFGGCKPFTVYIYNTQN